MAIHLLCTACQCVITATPQQVQGRPTCPKCGGLLKLTSTGNMDAIGRSSLSSDAEPTATDNRRRADGQRAELRRRIGSGSKYVTVRRRTLVAGGLLLPIFAAGGFACGWLLRARHPVATPPRLTTGPTLVQGQIRLQATEQHPQPMPQAIVVMWPVVTESNQKMTIDQFRSLHRNPSARQISANAAMVRRGIRSLGGEVSTTDEQGRYSLEIPAGDYYWMVVATQQTSPPTTLSTRSLAQLGRYLHDGYLLVEHAAVTWRQVHVQEDGELNQTFETTR